MSSSSKEETRSLSREEENWSLSGEEERRSCSSEEDRRNWSDDEEEGRWGSPSPRESKILKLVQEVRQKTRRNSHFGGDEDEEEKLRRRGEILRGLTIIESTRTAMGERGTEEELNALDNLIASLKKEAKAEDADLKMSIPEREEESGGSNGSDDWPFAPLAKRPKLVGSSSKAEVRCGGAGSAEGNLPARRFEKVLPILLKRRQLLKLDYSDFVNLSRASDAFKDAITSTYDESFNKAFAEGTYDLVQVLEFPFNEENVAPAAVDLPVKIIATTEGSATQELCEYLRSVGEKVWTLSLSSSGSICDFLQLLPNLRKLSVSDFNDGSRMDMSGSRDNRRFSRIPSLQLMELSGSQEHWRSYTKLLREYGAQLTGLSIEPLNFPTTFSARSFPNLSTLVFTTVIWNDWAWDEFDCDFDDDDDDMKDRTGRSFPGFRAFVGSPLKTIRFAFDPWFSDSKASMTVELFEKIMLSMHKFQLRFEELHLQLGVGIPIGSTASGMSELANLKFPSVKKLKIAGHPGSWTLPLYFPALEELTVTVFREYPAEVEEMYWRSRRTFGDYRGLEISWDREKMYTSKIWKLLPLLKTVTLDRWNEGGWEQLKITRAQCLKFQRRTAGASSSE